MSLWHKVWQGLGLRVTRSVRPPKLRIFQKFLNILLPPDIESLHVGQEFKKKWTRSRPTPRPLTLSGPDQHLHNVQCIKILASCSKALVAKHEGVGLQFYHTAKLIFFKLTTALCLEFFMQVNELKNGTEGWTCGHMIQGTHLTNVM